LEQTEVEEIERRARREGKSFGALARELMLSVLTPPKKK
jgi:hypothetical protein